MTDILATLAADPAVGVLAGADLREKRAKATQQGRWHADTYLDDVQTPCVSVDDRLGSACDCGEEEDAEHIAAEANPAHALAAVRRWRGVVVRHQPYTCSDPEGPVNRCDNCVGDEVYPNGVAVHRLWPCPDLTETADEIRAYLSGGAA